MVTLLGRFNWQKEGEQALVKLTAIPQPLKGILAGLHCLSLRLKSESGAEYAFYNCEIPLWTGLLRNWRGSYSCSIVAPASERTISRHRVTESVMVTETAELYSAVTAPHIAGVINNEGALAWLYNILSKEKEAERVLYEDPDQKHGFLLVIDTKWRSHPDPKNVPREQWLHHPAVGDLYCLAMCHQKGISSIRDLRGCHLPMLRNIYTKGLQTIEHVYGVPASKIRVFFHYHPQFYHLHIHFSRLNNPHGVLVEHARLLLDVVQNLESDDLYYQKRTIQYRIRSTDPLLMKMKEYTSRKEVAENGGGK
ncbi:unnamed protein product [Discosporangium mesarthrocarpum]